MRASQSEGFRYTLRRQNEARPRQLLRDEPKPASRVVEGVPRELERIISRCLRKIPERRFQNMADLKVALEELKEESDSGTLGVVSAVPRRQRRRLGWAFALLAIMAIVAGALWFVRSRSKAPEAALTPVPLTTYPVLLVPALGGPEHKVVEVYSQGLELYSLGAGTSNVPGPYLSWLRSVSLVSRMLMKRTSRL
jgi:hypothetical protein